MGELELARDSFVQLKDAGEAAIFARNGRANLYRLAGNLDRALREYKDVAAQYGYDYWSRCGIAQVLRLQGHASKAVSAYREVVEKFPYVPQGYIGLADVLAEQRRMLEAISTLVAAAKKFPEVPRIAIRLNAFRSRIGSSSTALADLDRLLAEYPDDIEAKAQRADTYRIMWRFEEALQDYEDILQSHPWNRSAKNGAASVHLAMGNFAKAEFLLETGVARSQEEWRAQLLLAHVLIQKNSYREARHLLKGALRRIPFAREKELMAATLASLELESGAPSNAVHLMEKSTMSASKVVRLHALAQARRKSAKSDLELVMSTTDKPFRPLINAIALRYGIAKGRSTQDHRWILTQERSAILSAA
jgi:tetratricopeptide (TPR) repeat protein